MDEREQRNGLLFALTAYTVWGVAPVYFMLVAFASPVEVIAYRVVFSVLILAALILLRRQLFALRHLDWSKVGWLLVSGLLIGFVLLLTIAGSSKMLTWTGATDAVWDVNTTSNWVDGATPEDERVYGVGDGDSTPHLT